MAATTEQISCATWQPLTVGISEKSKGPSPRAGHSFVFDPESNASYVFGGASHEEGLSNEIYQLDHGGLIQYIAKCPNSSSAVTATLTWRFLDLEGKPPARYEHCAVLASRRGRRVMLVLFGAADEQPLGDIWSLDLGILSLECMGVKLTKEQRVSNGRVLRPAELFHRQGL